MIHRGKRRRFAMAAAVRVREDYDAVQLRELAKRSADADQTRRLLALAAVYDGGSPTDAAQIGGGRPQTGPESGFSLHADGASRLDAGKGRLHAPHFSDPLRCS